MDKLTQEKTEAMLYISSLQECYIKDIVASSQSHNHLIPLNPSTAIMI